MGKVLACLSLALLLAITTAIPARSQAFFPGEELTYDVSFLGITLGTIKVVADSRTEFRGRQVGKVKAYIDSRPGMPFVSLHAIFDSYLDPSNTFSHQFESSVQEGSNSWKYDKYDFNYRDSIVKMETYMDKVLKAKKNVVTTKKWNDGCTLFFSARHLLFSKKNIRIPTIIEQDTVATTIHFDGREENVDLEGVDYPIRTVHLGGDANWTGLYGLTGKFEGWFSNDDARVPIKAKMKLYVGNVDITLRKWKRGNWQPPKAG